MGSTIFVDTTNIVEPIQLPYFQLGAFTHSKAVYLSVSKAIIKRRTDSFQVSPSSSKLCDVHCQIFLSVGTIPAAGVILDKREMYKVGFEYFLC